MKRAELFSILVVALILISVDVHAQNYLITSKSIGVSDGLPSRTVQTGIQDSDGFLWFGTLQGLARYDGADFLNFNAKEHGLFSNNVYQVVQDKNGYLWLLYATGSYSRSGPSGLLQLFDPKSLTVKDIKAVYPSFELRNTDVIQLISDPAENIIFLLGTGQLQAYVNGNMVDIGQYSINADSRWFSLTTVMKDDAYLWFAPNWHRLLKIDTLGQVVSELTVDKSMGIKPLRPTTDHNLLFAKYRWTENLEEENRIVKPQVFLWNERNSKSTPYQLYNKEERILKYTDLESYYGVGNPNAVILKGEKLALMDELGRTIDLPNITEDLPFVLEWRCFIDHFGNLWIGSVTKGVSKVSFNKSLFDTYLNRNHLHGDPNIWRNSRGTWQDSLRRLWIANLHGLHRVAASEPDSKPETLLDGKWCFGLAQIEEKVYVGADSLYVFDLNGSLSHRIRLQTDEWFEAMYCFHEHTDGTILIGSENGFKRLEQGHNVVVPFELLSELDNQNKLYVYEIFESSDKKLWATTSQGIIELDTALNGKSIRYHSTESGNRNIPLSEALTVFEDADGSFWIGTNGSGLIHWNRRANTIIEYTITDGLSSNQICGILPDNQNNLWLSSSFGLMRFNKETEKISIYNERDGIPHSEFNRTSSFKGNDDRLYFGGIDGTIGFNPDDFNPRNQEGLANFKITSIQQFKPGVEKPVDITLNSLQNGSVEMLPTDLYLMVSFSLLDFRPGKINYRYRITDLNNQWIPLDKNNVRLANLPYGTHVLEIQPQNSHGQWISSKSIEINVIAPFYRRTWFAVLSTICLVVLIVVFIRSRTLRLQREKQVLESEVKKRTSQIESDKLTIEEQAVELQELDRIKSRFFANISHELRTPLTLILGPLQNAIEKEYWNDPDRIKSMIERVSRNGEALLRLVEQILDLSKLESGKLIINKQPVIFESVMQKLKDPFYQLADSKQISFSVSSKLTGMIDLDQDKFERILYNLLSNAFKFTELGGEVAIEVKEEDTFFHVSVIDTGTGISEEELPYVFNRFYQSSSAAQTKIGGSGIGLAFSKELAEALGGDITASSVLGKGSVFTLTLPLQRVSVQLLNQEHGAIEKELPAIEIKDGTKNKTVLIVEDNEDMRQYLEEILSDYFKVRATKDGMEALELLRSDFNNVDLILSDVMMPRLDGFGLLEKVKSSEDLRTKPFILLTAKASVESKVQALRIGVDDYLFKPFSNYELLARINGLLINSELRKGVDLETEETQVEAIPEVEKDWLMKLELLCKENVGNTAYGVADLAIEMALSERQLTRNLKKLTGLTPNRYFREIKLHTARELIQTGRYRMLAEVSHHVGFDDPQYFARIYQEHFGSRPF